MTMLDTIREEQPVMFETMQDLAMFIVLAENIGQNEKAKNARFLFNNCLHELAKKYIPMVNKGNNK